MSNVSNNLLPKQYDNNTVIIRLIRTNENIFLYYTNKKDC